MTDPHDPALAAFGRIQERSYFDPGMLIPPQAFPRLVADGSRNRLLVAEEAGGQVLGGTLYHLLAGAAFSSFVAVDPAARGRGVSRALHAARLDDVRAHGLAGLFADSVAPDRQSAEERAAEGRVGTDARERRAILHALGYRTVDLPYWQPTGGPDGGPLTDLDLIYQPLDGQDSVAVSLVTGTMEAYWRGWLRPGRARQEARDLARRAGTDTARLLPATASPAYWSTSDGTPGAGLSRPPR